MGVYTQSQGNWLSRRGGFLVLLIGFHLAFFWALKSGFAVKLVQQITQPIKAEIINEVKPEEPPPPPPEVQMELPPVQVPPVLVDIQLPAPPPTAIQAPVTTEVVPPAPPPPPAPPARPVQRTRFQLTYVPDPQDYYPSASRSLQEEGIVRVQICWGTNGRIDTSQLKVAESSGFSRLDDAALRLARGIRMKPGTVDGKPEADCATLPVRFTLKGESDR
jgi:protein TonB